MSDLSPLLNNAEILGNIQRTHAKGSEVLICLSSLMFSEASKVLSATMTHLLPSVGNVSAMAGFFAGSVFGDTVG
jgi:ABC-type methionine transport system permease subunit